MSFSEKKSLAATSAGLPERVRNLFTVPESADTALGKLDKELSANSLHFLNERLEAQVRALSSIEQDFSDPTLPDHACTSAEHLRYLLDTLLPQATNTSSPAFIGHMTSALPQFILPLSKLMSALNQNVVKLETSGSFTPMERQVLAMLHNMIYQGSDAFYQRWIQCDEGALGVFCSGGTVANITALWNARNIAFKPKTGFKGVSEEGMAAALRFYGYQGAAILVSQRGHYSLSKAIDVLGIGRESLISIPVDDDNRIRLDKLEHTCAELSAQGIKLMALIGIAGTTETGSIDPLDAMATIASQYDMYFHVDAAWGGATLMSDRGRALMRGVEKADSVTIDAHKQMYVPMGAGMVIFKDPETVASIEHHANYILRRGSRDLGRHSLEGSRPGIAMLVHACLHIIGRRGYEALIDHSLDKARYFADLIKEHKDFELVSEPQLCLLTYRYVPGEIQSVMASAEKDTLGCINHLLNELTVDIQVAQRDAGTSFVSRTQLSPLCYHSQQIIVFRVVLANPLTSPEILKEVLKEQAAIARGLTTRMGAVWAEAFPDSKNSKAS